MSMTWVNTKLINYAGIEVCHDLLDIAHYVSSCIVHVFVQKILLCDYASTFFGLHDRSFP